MRCILLLLFFTLTQSVLSQETDIYTTVLQKFKENYNKQDVEAIYHMYTSELQENTTKDGVSQFVNGCYEQFGNLKSIAFVETAEKVNTYAIEFDKATLSMDVQLNPKGKISTIQFQEL